MIQSKKAILKQRLREEVKVNEHLDVIFGFMLEKEDLFNSIKSTYFQHLNDLDLEEKVREACQF